LLDMARIEAGAVKLKTEPVDLVDAVSAALRDVRPAVGDDRVSVDIADNLPLVRADAQLLHHCLINLIDNAARYSEGGGSIRLAANGQRGEVRLTVEDEGPGLPQDAERALDAFSRIAGSDRKGGAGLGLAIVKAFAEAMGAKVLAANRDEGGAVFSLVFPKPLVVKAAAAVDAG
jgi:two-component system sensor histidine kinase KdpD